MKLIFIALLVAPAMSWAQTKSNKETTTQDSKSEFRCERYMGRDLAVLKAKLQDNCNLNKPFSASLSVFTGEDTFLYCCHTK